MRGQKKASSLDYLRRDAEIEADRERTIPTMDQRRRISNKIKGFWHDPKKVVGKIIVRQRKGQVK